MRGFWLRDARTSRVIAIEFDEVKELRGENAADRIQFAAQVVSPALPHDVAGGSVAAPPAPEPERAQDQWVDTGTTDRPDGGARLTGGI